MRHLSAVMLIMLLVVAPSCDYFKNRGLFGKKSKTLEALRAEQASSMIADSVRLNKEKLLAIENARIDSIRLDAEARQASARQAKYNIIVGSFITDEYAKAYAENFRQQGYNAEILMKPGSKFALVSAESHESLRKAISRLKQFQDTVEIDSWIYVRK